MSRRLVDRMATLACGTAVAIAFVPLVSLLWTLLARGATSLSWNLVTRLPAPVGETGGGLANAIAGTLYMVTLASLLALPLGIGIGVFLAARGRTKLGGLVAYLCEMLSGIPSIVVGVVVYGIVVVPMKRFSALAGALALALLMIAPLARAAADVLRTVPTALVEASLALGVPRWRTTLSIVLRTASGALANAALLSIARALGETAPLLFTSLNNQFWNFNPTQPTASLTVQIYTYAISPYEEWQRQAWAGALCLLVLTALISSVARALVRTRSPA